VRDAASGERTAAEIVATTGSDAVHMGALDLADQASVAAFADGWSGPLHMLVNNAGVMAIPELRRTPEGWELQFATNHLGHFALAVRLHGSLAAASDARVVSLSSGGHMRSPVLFEDLAFERHPYDPWVAYGQSKTANILFAVEATRRCGADGITANAVHPGAIAETNLARHMDPAERAALSGAFRWKTPEQGAATSVLVATSPLLEGVGGRYFEDCNEAEPLPEGTTIGPSGAAPYALDPANAERLWAVSEELTGLRD
jgi:NAD(P)-dependent dehydrogenase (short-subunit alcohol dehydrogenase family)